MSQATKRKHVTREVMDEFVSLKSSHKIARVISSRGNNLHDVEISQGETCLASMPPKFRKNVWIKRGDYVIVEDIPEGSKVKAEIVHILYKHNIKQLIEEGVWPSVFTADIKPNADSKQNLQDDHPEEEKQRHSSCSVSSNEDNSDLFVNTNRPTLTYGPSSSSSESEDEAHAL